MAISNMPEIGITPSNGDLLTARQAATITGHTEHTLAQYRSRRDRGRDVGPHFIKIGKAVFYTKADLEAYAARRAAR
tara:strand:- start:974 stop:1204 length:231 start_codon:yes stop_codon:yes gene_type:complete